MARKNDKRFLQANREALFALAAYALYFLWWYLTAYGLGSDSPDNYGYTLGMPDWFFYSCVLGYPVACLLVWGLVRFFFKDMPLDDDDASQAPEVPSSREHHPGQEERPRLPLPPRCSPSSCIWRCPLWWPCGPENFPASTRTRRASLRNTFWAAAPWAALCWP